MKALYLSSFLIAAMLFSSCEIEDVIENSNDLLVGVWTSSEIYIESLDHPESHIYTDYSAWLSLNDSSYYYNYVIGNWEVTDNSLLLTPKDGLPSRTYQIKELSADKMVLEITMTEAAYFCNFEEFESGENLRIVETFSRHE